MISGIVESPLGTRTGSILGAAQALGERSGVLRVPLLGKLLGANALLTVAALAMHELVPAMSMAAQLWVTLLLSFGVSGALAWLALRPIAQLEATAARVSAGDYDARVPASPLADRDVQSLADTMNRLLDHVQADRMRIHYLAGRSVRARDIERESVARELRDSMAQMVAAIALQLNAAQQTTSDPAMRAHLDQTRQVVRELTEEMRSVAESLYPGTLGEFGLANGVQALARRVARRSKIRIEVEDDLFVTALSYPVASALFRLADEALRNVEQWAAAHNVRITLKTNGHVMLDIEDDGRGMDLKSQDPLQAGLGLFSARAVLALVGGEIQISSAPGKGTRVTARVSLGTQTPRA